MNALSKTVAFAAHSAPLLMTTPTAAGGLMSPEELFIRGTINGINSIARDAERHWDFDYALKKCLKRFTSRGTPASIAHRHCRRFR